MHPQSPDHGPNGKHGAHDDHEHAHDHEHTHDHGHDEGPDGGHSHGHPEHRHAEGPAEAHDHEELQALATAESAEERQRLFIELQEKARQDYIRQSGPIARALRGVRHKVAILSGKGGVGKTTLTINLAATLHEMGHSVVVFDADVHGPSVPKMLGALGRTGIKPLHDHDEADEHAAHSGGGCPASKGHSQAHGHSYAHGHGQHSGDDETEPNVDHHSFLFEPVMTQYGVGVVSVASIWPNEETPVLWKGPHKMRAIRQFLSAANWGEVDFLLVDLPPGTGDEVQTIMTAIPGLDGMLVITTPQGVSRMVCSKAVSCARELNAPILGLVENMGLMCCPHCGGPIKPFGQGKGERLARMMDVPFWGSIPFGADVGAACDQGVPAVVDDPEGTVAEAFRDIAQRLLVAVGEEKSVATESR
jgi:ATP-binding protein involved in chromosome partitioning